MKESLISSNEWLGLVYHCNDAVLRGEKSFEYQGKTFGTGFKYIIALMAKDFDMNASIGKDGKINL